MIVCAVAWSSLARAQSIEVEGRDACITERSLTAALQRYAEHLPADPSLRARVRLALPALSFEVVRDGAVLAERDFESLPRRCVARVRAVAIAIALAFESVQEREQAQAAAQPAEAAPTEQAQATAQPAGAAPTERAKPEPEAKKIAEPAKGEPERGEGDEPAADGARRSPIVIARAGAGLLIGVLPKPAPAFALGAAIPLGQVLRLELSALLTTRVTSELAGGVVDSQLFGGEGALCAGAERGAFRIAGCAGVAPVRCRPGAASSLSAVARRLPPGRRRCWVQPWT